MNTDKKTINHVEEIIKIKNNCVIYNTGWQYPAITEQYAFHKIKEIKTLDEKSVYIAFPWATLIDLLQTKKDGSDILLEALKEIKSKISGKENVITVCQHINMLRFEELFSDLDITHVFWTHAIKGESHFPKNNQIKISPFPLYPVQAVDDSSPDIVQKKYLYSFVGARAKKWYLTESRNFIIDILSKDKRGLVIGRDQWHYQKVVYEGQIAKTADSKVNLVDKNTLQEFIDTVKNSIFSLCPSGSGPNSIRLWESIGFGSIPVILANTYLPPGNINLWNDAVVFCEETEEAISALPDRLEEMAKDSDLLERKRHAMRQLWMMYGPDCFIYDIENCFLNHHNFTNNSCNDKQFMNVIQNNDGMDKKLATIIISGFITRLLLDKDCALKLFEENYVVKKALIDAIDLTKENENQLLKQLIKKYKIVL